MHKILKIAGYVVVGGFAAMMLLGLLGMLLQKLDPEGTARHAAETKAEEKRQATIAKETAARREMYQRQEAKIEQDRAEKATALLAEYKEKAAATCGPIDGKTSKDVHNVMRFCSAVPKDLDVQGAYATEMLLWIKIDRPLALLMRSRRLDAEQVMHAWMRAWKSVTGSQVVTLTVEYGDVKIATGQTTVFSGDEVTIH